MNCNKVTCTIVDWLRSYPNSKGFVVGISGGIDSAVVSTLCAMTRLPTVCITMPINKTPDQLNRAYEHMSFLKNNYSNVTECSTVNLTDTFDTLKKGIPSHAMSDLSLANTQSRLRMVVLYAYANSLGYLVAGTGNKVEDYGVGFFTKYGDGGIDLSPIGDLTKTEVYELARYLEVVKSIQVAKPTDGLWDDSRSDEEAIGASYPELEWAMDLCESLCIETIKDYEELYKKGYMAIFTGRQKEVLEIYLKRHENSQHKMSMPPICHLKKL
jgi:NAD+ synthase